LNDIPLIVTPESVENLRSGAMLFTTLLSFQAVQQYGLRNFPEMESRRDSANTIKREINKESQGVSRFIFKKERKKVRE
jgi:hypothetical protein